MSSSKRMPLGQFPTPIIIPPSSSSHKSTIIFLHGRGSNAKKFHDPLLSTPLTKHENLREALPHTRFVFPTAPLMRATKYRRSIIHQWYDGSGDWELNVRGYMSQSVEHIHGLIRQEIQLLGGNSKRVALAGISQGHAMCLTSMLLWEGDSLGAVVGMCGYMPLNAYLTEILDGKEHADTDEGGGIVFEADDDDTVNETVPNNEREALQKAVAELREEVELPRASQPSSLSFLSTPVFLGHGTADNKVKCCHGRQAAMFLEKAGLQVEFRTYQDLGHWYSQDMLEHIIAFLTSKAGL